MNITHKRYAFISYNRKDEKWAKWLQKRLESYKLPTGTQNEFESSKYLRPIFRDKTDLNTGILADELRTELKCSKYLIVICSPNSAKSAWVSEEVKAYIEMGRIDYIIPFIVDGTPHNYKDRDPETPFEDECFPYYLRFHTREHPESELLGININEVGKEAAFIRVVSRMLSLSFDVLWERNKRQKRQEMILRGVIAALFLLVTGYVWHINQPFDLSLTISEHPQHGKLPYVDGRVEIYLENDILQEDITCIGSPLIFKNIPSRYIDEKVRIVHTGFGFRDLDTLITLSREAKIDIHRTPDTYGLVQGHAMDYEARPLPGARVEICGFVATTDDVGHFEIRIPLDAQLPSEPGYVAIVTIGDRTARSTVYPASNCNISNTIYVE
jgi:hypothetical protein